MLIANLQYIHCLHLDEKLPSLTKLQALFLMVGEVNSKLEM